MKNFYVYLILVLTVFPTIVFATNANSSVYSGNSASACLSGYQDSSVTIDNDVYFSHCIEAKCEKNNYRLTYYSNNTVTCSNGNKSPYVENINRTACSNVSNKLCNEGDDKFCSIILYYDCTRNSNGTSFTTTSITKKPTTKKRTTRKTTTSTTTTTTKVEINTKLQSLTLSYGNIDFNSDIYEYDLLLKKDINSIDVIAIPIDSNSKVEVKDNTNLITGSVIKVIVTGSDGTTSTYNINIIKETVKSNNANLKSLMVEGDELNFQPNIFEYQIEVDADVTELNIDYALDDDKSSVRIEGNENIVDESKVNIVVTAEDGTVNTYSILVQVKSSINIFLILFIIIIILALGAIGYYIYTKIKSKQGDKYEYE